MPALPNVPGVIRRDFHFTVGQDSFAKCRLFIKYTGSAPTSGDLTTIAGVDRASFATHMADDMSVDNSLTSVVWTDLSSPTGAVGIDSTAVPGTDTHGTLGADACLLESRQIARRYRGGHSRVYWPFGTQNDIVDQQHWAAAFVSDVAADAGLWQGDVVAAVWSGGGSLQAVAVSYYHGFTVLTGTTGRARNVSTVRLAPLVDPIVQGVFRAGIAVQRKRLLHLA